MFYRGFEFFVGGGKWGWLKRGGEGERFLGFIWGGIRFYGFEIYSFVGGVGFLKKLITKLKI